MLSPFFQTDYQKGLSQNRRGQNKSYDIDSPLEGHCTFNTRGLFQAKMLYSLENCFK